MRQQVINVSDEAAMQEVAIALLDLLDPDAVVYLQGQLGAGKTTLVRFILRQLGYTGAVKSPTYTLVEPYNLPSGAVLHVDLYRVNDPYELELSGIDQQLDQGGLKLIEWPDRGGMYLPEANLCVDIHVQADNRREIIITPNA